MNIMFGVLCICHSNSQSACQGYHLSMHINCLQFLWGTCSTSRKEHRHWYQSCLSVFFSSSCMGQGTLTLVRHEDGLESTTTLPKMSRRSKEATRYCRGHIRMTCSKTDSSKSNDCYDKKKGCSNCKGSSEFVPGECEQIAAQRRAV